MTQDIPLEETEQRARALFAEGDFVSAEPFFAALVEAAPENPVAQYNHGVVLSKLGAPEAALSRYRRAIELNPHFADAYTNFGVCLNELNLIPQARQGFALARQIAPDSPVPVLNEGIAALALGDYAAGWKDFTARWQIPAYAKHWRAFDQPYWSGEDLKDKTIFLFAEQGFGDTLQMARYIPLLAARGARVVVEAPSALLNLMRTVKGVAQVILKGEEPPAFDTYCALMDLPLGFATTLATIPSQTPYLTAEADEIEKYRALLPAGTKRVGLSWAGRATHENDANRSLSFARIEPLTARKDIGWVSLQRLMPSADATRLSASAVADWGQNFADFSQTAAAIMTLDLVITVDTAIAHLAGALGKPVWVLLPYYADWRWLTGRADSPWYPTARLFRQQKRRDWTEVLSKVAASL